MLTRTGETRQPINLAHVAPFRLGAVEVHPATRQLIRGGASETIEPRVMQVLVALALADGAVVTRDELTDLCWGGRIVSENAINRVISRLRQIASDFASGSFEIETITKVGYRIVATQATEGRLVLPHASEPPTSAPDALFSRRAMIGGGIATAGVIAAGAYAILTRTPAIDRIRRRWNSSDEASLPRGRALGSKHVRQSPIIARRRGSIRFMPMRGAPFRSLTVTSWKVLRRASLPACPV
jgi:DNA-binding winged helix-turn-helix (wHTH) protein